MTHDEAKITEATQWLLRLSEEDASGDDIAEWQQWLKMSTEHRAAFERARAVWSLASRVNPVPWPTDREVAEDSLAGYSQKSRWRSLALAAAIAGLAVGAAALWQVQRASNLLTTAIGENRTVALADGSRVTLGGASRLHLALDEHARSLELRSGEAFFEVAKDPQRPFIVRAGEAQITAVGTAFNVRRAGDRIQVAVTSGVVKLASDSGQHQTRLEAGRQAIVMGAAVLPPAAAEIRAVLARKEGRLQYTSEPLRYVVEDLSRYSKVSIEIDGRRTGELLVTGTVLENDLKGWMQGLEKALPVVVSFGEKRIVIASRPQQ